MSDEGSRPAKRARGNYAKLICLRCRERRIKCHLPDDGSVIPSSEPQPADRACSRCAEQGLACVVRKTTLGRPNQQKRQYLPTPSSTDSNQVTQRQSRSPSPYAEDLVLLTLNEEHDGLGSEKRTSVLPDQPTSVQMFGAINRTFDLTSALLARDKRFGSSIAELKDVVPAPLEDILNEDLMELLDQHLVWHRIYMPWLPNLLSLYKEVVRKDAPSATHLPTNLLLALLSSIALDIPSENLEPYRRLQRDLRCHVYITGQKVLFTLPRHEHTLTALELVHGHRPLSLIDSQEAAAHTLSGHLYGTLINAVQQRLGMDNAASRLRNCLNTGHKDEIPQLVSSTLRRCASIMFGIGLDLEEIDTTSSEAYRPAEVLTQALETVAEAIDLGCAPSEYFFLFHALRYHADDLLACRDITTDWQNLDKLAAHIEAHTRLKEQRKQHFDEGLSRFFLSQGRTEEALSLSQLANTEPNQGLTNVIGLAMFYAIMAGAHNMQGMTKSKHNSMAELSRYYTERVNEAASSTIEQSPSYAFLDRFGDMHMDGLERRLTDFINVASDLYLDGIRYIGPPRHTTSNVLMACKEIVENNAVRIRIDGSLHSRIDMQLILFQEAARRLEAMEADGGSADAVARGSVFTASGKLVRNLHRIMWQWKRSYAMQTKQPPGQQPVSNDNLVSSNILGILPSNAGPGFGFNPDDPLADGFFTDWDNWPQLGPTDLSNIFTYDFDIGNI